MYCFNCNNFFQQEHVLAKIKGVKDIDVRKKHVLVRVDFNVPVDENNNITDDLRIKEALPTINYLIKNKAKIVLISHFKQGILTSLQERLSLLLNKNIETINDCTGEIAQQKIKTMKEEEVLLLDNIRKEYGEKDNSPELGKKIASLGDIFINDAFSVSHRQHASVAQAPLFIHSGIGLLMEKEVKTLEHVVKNPQKPITVIIGGSKAESKISAIDYFLDNADYVLLGGKIANTVMAEKKIISDKLYLPIDAIVSNKEGDIRECLVENVKNNENIFDIGSKTISLYKEIIAISGTIIWAGPIGIFEQEEFSQGTKEIGEMISANKKAIKISGGGDTNSALNKFNLLSKMNLFSCGGGAMLAYLTKKEMPGIEALKLTPDL